MFVTVLFGDNKMEMLNLNCKLLSFISHLKERCGLDDKECVELMDSSGRLMSLEGKQQSMALASSILEERRHYILLRVHRDEGHGDQKYAPLLSDFNQSHPELTELLRRLSDPDKDQAAKVRGGRQRSKQSRSKK